MKPKFVLLPTWTCRTPVRLLSVSLCVVTCSWVLSGGDIRIYSYTRYIKFVSIICHFFFNWKLVPFFCELPSSGWYIIFNLLITLSPFKWTDEPMTWQERKNSLKKFSQKKIISYFVFRLQDLAGFRLSSCYTTHPEAFAMYIILFLMYQSLLLH